MYDVASKRKVTTDSIDPGSKPGCARQAAFNICRPITQFSVLLGRLRRTIVEFYHGELSPKGGEDLMIEKTGRSLRKSLGCFALLPLYRTGLHAPLIGA